MLVGSIYPLHNIYILQNTMLCSINIHSSVSLNIDIHIGVSRVTINIYEKKYSIYARKDHNGTIQYYSFYQNHSTIVYQKSMSSFSTYLLVEFNKNCQISK